MYLCLNKLASKYGKGIALVFLIYTVQSSKNTRVILFLFINFIAVFPFSFVSYATNLLHLFFNQVCFEKKKKKEAAHVLMFFSVEWLLCSLYMQIYPLNACKLDCKEKLFDFYVDSIAFTIKILINLVSI